MNIMVGLLRHMSIVRLVVDIVTTTTILMSGVIFGCQFGV